LVFPVKGLPPGNQDFLPYRLPAAPALDDQVEQGREDQKHAAVKNTKVHNSISLQVSDLGRLTRSYIIYLNYRHLNRSSQPVKVPILL
jgi:gamma-glutamylcysteine synthetase